MKARHARLIRLGIHAARDPERRPYIHLAHPLVWEAARRELKNIYWRGRRAHLEAVQAKWNPNHALPYPAYFDGFVYIETGDPIKDAANRLAIFGATGTIPQRVLIGTDPKETS